MSIASDSDPYKGRTPAGWASRGRGLTAPGVPIPCPTLRKSLQRLRTAGNGDERLIQLRQALFVLGCLCRPARNDEPLILELVAPGGQRRIAEGDPRRLPVPMLQTALQGHDCAHPAAHMLSADTIKGG